MFSIWFGSGYHFVFCRHKSFVFSPNATGILCFRFFCTVTFYLLYHVLISTPTLPLYYFYAKLYVHFCWFPEQSFSLRIWA